MKERILALSLGFSFSFPMFFNSFKLQFVPIHDVSGLFAYRPSVGIMENHKEVTKVIDVDEGEYIEVSNDTDNLLSSGDEETVTYYNKSSGDLKVELSTDEAKERILAPFIRYEYLPTNSLVVQHITERENGYWSNVDMKSTSNYDTVQGISTFRGSNYRQNAFYGKLEITENKLEKIWTNSVGRTDNWTGIGWNGQPSIIKWNTTVKNQMNIYDEFKLKEDFTEVIVGGLDSTIHFYDLESGLPSRPSIKVPSSIKGSVTIDPRGYPLLYVGQGIDKVAGKNVKFGYHIFSLINGEELFFINGRDKYAYLSWGAFDGNPIIDAETDTMFLPGENGLVYIVNLNTSYDKENGTISISPVTSRYRSKKYGRAGGIENAIAIYRNYAFFGNNNGLVQCLELNSLSPVWSFDMEDDIDATIGIDEENGKACIYVACEVDKRKTEAPAYVRKLDGRTGKEIWSYSCNCKYNEDVNGGVLSSPIVGQNSISDLVIFNFSKTTSLYSGKMVALNKADGKVVWEKDLKNYSWGSPVAVYTESGKAYIVFCDSSGTVFLIDARTGETNTSLVSGGGNVEGSPAIFDNHIVFGTRGQRVYRIDIK